MDEAGAFLATAVSVIVDVQELHGWVRFVMVCLFEGAESLYRGERGVFGGSFGVALCWVSYFVVLWYYHSIVDWFFGVLVNRKD